MLESFELSLPDSIHFGKGAVAHLANDASLLGKRVLIVCAGASYAASGAKAEVESALSSAGAITHTISGIRANPETAQLLELLPEARDFAPDFCLAVGGGSVIDFTKTLIASLTLDADIDIWQHYFIERKARPKECPELLVVLTYPATGSELNSGAVMTNSQTREKYDADFGTEALAKAVYLDPTFCQSLTKAQLAAGIYDMFCHVAEQYLGKQEAGILPDSTDVLAEALMAHIVQTSRIYSAGEQSYEVFANLMWDASLALCGLMGAGKSSQDWMVHSCGQALGGVLCKPHGETLSAVSYAYYNYLLQHADDFDARFARLGKAVFGADTAAETLRKLTLWMDSLGLPTECASWVTTDAQKSFITELLPKIKRYADSYCPKDDGDIAHILEAAFTPCPILCA